MAWPTKMPRAKDANGQARTRTSKMVMMAVLMNERSRCDILASGSCTAHFRHESACLSPANHSVCPRTFGAQMRPRKTTLLLLGVSDGFVDSIPASRAGLGCWIQIRPQIAPRNSSLALDRKHELCGHAPLGFREPVPDLRLRSANPIGQWLLATDFLARST